MGGCRTTFTSWRAQRTRSLAAAVALLLLALGRAPLQAQEVGARLRVETLSARYTGSFVAATADTLFLHHPGTRIQFSVPMRDVLFAQESMGRGRPAMVVRDGVQIGLLGAVLGTVLALVIDGRSDAEPALFGAGVGAVVGAGFALFQPARERWRPIQISTAP
jgi:hypothetical protein